MGDIIDTSPDAYLVTRALRELDGRLPEDFPHMDINVVGGFALQVLKVRTDVNQATDLDYIGKPLPASVMRVVDEVGLQFGLDPKWFNNDVLLAGYTSVADIEGATGPLTFIPNAVPGLRHFTVAVADAKSILRMKLVAIDTQLVTYLDDAFRSDFTRGKDLADISLLAAYLRMTEQGVAQLVADMGAAGILLAPIETCAVALAAIRGLGEPEALQAARRAVPDTM